MFTEKCCSAGLIPLVILVLLQLLQGSCHARNQNFCPNYSSSCGIIKNISYPFRLKGDPESCGDKRYELICENNVTELYMNYRKYHVQAINYKNYTIRVVDVGVEYINVCSSIYNFNFSYSDSVRGPLYDLYEYFSEDYYETYLTRNIVFFNCTNPVIDDSLYVTMDTNASCNLDYSKEKGKQHGHIYATITYGLNIGDLKVGCYVKTVGLTSWGLSKSNVVITKNKKTNVVDIRRALVYGFELSWLNAQGICDNYCGNWTGPKLCSLSNNSSLKVICIRKQNY
ncbi:Receptor-like protein kinase [Quillaja saponaria]|uniref:Receptor-like protein kinase n=1 Tax=Quillaja saponaria TaxID=32244 RepID=A0AAD7LP91_QUISA|nr:Receptor-like protein kinase [Quillaja saponaria]